MFKSSLQCLVDAARALPGEKLPARPPELGLATATEPPVELEPRAHRQQLGRLLRELAQRLEPALLSALRHAAVAWDAFDEVAVLDDGLRGEAAALATVARHLESTADPARRALGLELRLTLESALGLVELCERRLATLVRLRVASADPSLLPGERPFLDVAAALAEAAEGWT